MASKNLEVSLLLDCYGVILTQKQYSMLEFYYNDDLSLSEIAENEGITRQGVRDTIKRATDQLIDLESKLKFYEYQKKTIDKLSSISDLANKIINNNDLAESTAKQIINICIED